MKFLGDRL